MNEDASPECTITVTLTELEFGALAGAISKAMDHWRSVDPNSLSLANWMNEQIERAWEKVLKAWFPTKSPKEMREGYSVMFGPIPKDIQEKVKDALNAGIEYDDENVIPMRPRQMNSEGVWGRW
jgi:hypothetical protein